MGFSEKIKETSLKVPPLLSEGKNCVTHLFFFIGILSKNIKVKNIKGIFHFLSFPKCKSNLGDRQQKPLK